MHLRRLDNHAFHGFSQSRPLINGAVAEAALPIYLKVIVPIVVGEPQVAMALAKQRQFLELGHLYCSPGRDGVATLKAHAPIFIPSVRGLLLRLKRHDGPRRFGWALSTRSAN